jgi:alkanesulfonate monooxygenase SsuD/methylene tetrahydromethanopterin reductase-like flavin-dependent oxidoreductase (luciferase family)
VLTRSQQMQFFMFHLMPWPHLPADFDRYESSSVTFPNTFYDPERGHELYNRYLDELEYAERLGFDGVCVNEHHQTAYGNMPSPNIMAAMLARRTSRITLAIVGNGLPLRANPLRVAEEVAMIDVTSGGRVISGFVRGIGMEYFGTGVNPTYSRERFYEAHDLILKAWTTPGPFRWIGKHYRYNYVNIWPRPLQQPHPPIWVPGVGSRETIEWMAEKEYTYLSVYAPKAQIQRWFDQLREAYEARGKRASPDRIGMLLPIYVAETDAQAHEEGRKHVMWLFGKALRMKFEHLIPPGYVGLDGIRAGLTGRARKPFHELSYEELLENGQAIVGSPASVRDQLAEFQQDLGFGVLCALLHIGDMPHDRTLRSMEFFANEVMPHFLGARAAAPAAAS